MGLYYFECNFGCGLRKAKSLARAESSIQREVGSIGCLSLVEKASDDRIRCVASMGGFVPTNVRKRLGLPIK